MTNSQQIQALGQLVCDSYAHNSKIYRYLETDASLAEITQFLRWDGEQPPFNVFLRHWLTKAPFWIIQPLAAHIHEEEVEEHSRLFRETLVHLNSKVPGQTILNQGVLNELNYTFSARCAAEKDYGFFLGSFFATEIMSAKRCRQVQDGLLRNGVEQGRLDYFKLHCDHDAVHAEEVLTQFMVPTIEHEPALIASIGEGLHDRLRRSGEYLKWYENEYL